jgi:DNA modification methylase
VPEIDVILGSGNEAKTDNHLDDAVPATTRIAVSRPGDFWKLGNHRLLCGNALDDSSYSRLLEDSKANLVITDPPYNVAINGHVGGNGEVQHGNFQTACGEMTAPVFTAYLSQVFRHLVAFSTDGSIHYIFMDWRGSYKKPALQITPS